MNSTDASIPTIPSKSELIREAATDEITQEQYDQILRKRNPKLTVTLTDSLITDYINAKSKLTDAYPEYHHASIVALLSVIINKNARLELSTGTIYPNIWPFTLGKSTVSRKTTACDYCRELINDVYPEMILSYPGSPEAFIEDLEGDERVDGEENKGHGVLIRDEAAGFLAAMQKTYMADMRDTLCQLYDGRPFTRKIRSGQRKKKTLFNLQNPYLTLYFATTPAAFKEHSSSSDVLSGWLIRFLFYAPDYEKEILPLGSMSNDDRERYKVIYKQLQKTKEFFKKTHVSFTLDGRTKEYYNKWMINYSKSLQTSGEEDRGAFGRLSIYALKLAMIYTVAKKGFSEDVGPGGWIDIDHNCLVEACREISDYFIPITRSVIEIVGENEEKNTINKVLRVIRDAGKVTRRELSRATHLKKRDIDDAIEALEEGGEIEIKKFKPQNGPLTFVYIFSGSE